MKPHEICAAWKGDKHFAKIAKRAAELQKKGQQPPAILATLQAEFGSPPVVARLREVAQPLRIYGEIGREIESGALDQIKLALRLPIAIRGALMPDAHPGYALPIGGVFEAHRAVAPAMVGVDIGCRMHLTLFDLPPTEFARHRTPLFADLKAVTLFGTGQGRDKPLDHPVLADSRWQRTKFLHNLLSKATAQLGTSGSGNHFAELVMGERLGAEGDNIPQTFAGLLTHSGSRGMGYEVASHYIRLAAQECKGSNIPHMYEWLDLDGEAGQEYWAAMELAGAFAKANHELIHALFARRTGLKPLTVVQNHHNFAWRNGDKVIHRKGATPAEKGVLGVIPGSMGTSSYIVRGGGAEEALQSASHGAGRTSSRAVAKDKFSLSAVRQQLKEADILIEGLSVDEAPQAYKDIERVMQVQVEAGLVEPIARMRPVAVIMAGEKGRT